jgi:glycosyltransferase involved in cell wall biosynthesis
MPLRIAHVANEVFGVRTANGVQHVVHSLAHTQAQLGESVAVFTRDDRGMHILGGSPPASPHPATKGGRARASARQRLLSTYFEPSLTDDVLAWQPDIVHFHSVHIPQNVALAAHLDRIGIPYCVTVHGGLFSAALRRHRIKKAVFNLLFERRYLNAAQFIHALSPGEAEVIQRHGVTCPLVVAPNGLPPQSDSEAVRPDALYAHHPSLRGRRVFMFIGRLDPWQKGLDLLVEAFALARLPRAALVLVGPEFRGSRRTLTSLAERLGVVADVVFVDAAFGQDRANLFAAADVFVHPSRWEGVSLSVLAAAAAGKPCLLTREADPLGELERAQAAILVEGNVLSLSEGLRRAAALSRRELEDMGIRARRAAEARFTWTSMAHRLGEAYRRALDSPSYLAKSSGDTIRRTDNGA